MGSDSPRVLSKTLLRLDVLLGPLRARRTTIVALATLGITPLDNNRPPSSLHRLHWRGVEHSLESASNTSRGKTSPDVLTGDFFAAQDGPIAVTPLDRQQLVHGLTVEADVGSDRGRWRGYAKDWSYDRCAQRDRCRAALKQFEACCW